MSPGAALSWPYWAGPGAWVSGQCLSRPMCAWLCCSKPHFLMFLQFKCHHWLQPGQDASCWVLTRLCMRNQMCWPHGTLCKSGLALQPQLNLPAPSVAVTLLLPHCLFYFWGGGGVCLKPRWKNIPPISPPAAAREPNPEAPGRLLREGAGPGAEPQGAAEGHRRRAAGKPLGSPGPGPAAAPRALRSRSGPPPPPSGPEPQPGARRPPPAPRLPVPLPRCPRISVPSSAGLAAQPRPRPPAVPYLGSHAVPGAATPFLPFPSFPPLPPSLPTAAGGFPACAPARQRRPSALCQARLGPAHWLHASARHGPARPGAAFTQRCPESQHFVDRILVMRERGMQAPQWEPVPVPRATTSTPCSGLEGGLHAACRPPGEAGLAAQRLAARHLAAHRLARQPCTPRGWSLALLMPLCTGFVASGSWGSFRLVL